MAYIALKNYDNNYSDIEIPVVVTSDNVLNALTAGDFEDSNGITWHVARSAGNNIATITITPKNRVPGLDHTKIKDMLEDFGLEEAVAGLNNLRYKFEAGNNFRCGMGENSITYPYIRFQETVATPNPNNETVTVTINPQFTSNYAYTTSGASNVKDSPGSYAALLAIKAGGRVIYGTFLGSFTNYGASGIYGTLTIQYNTTNALTDINFASVELDPGDEGFKPTGKTTGGKNRGGGSKSGHKPKYETDEIEQPGAPDESTASAVGSGFITAYQIGAASLANVGKCLYSSTLLTAIANLFVNPLDAIISLNVFPCSPNTGALEAVKLINHSCTETDLGISATAYKLANQFKVFDFGTVTVGEEWESFLDYEATSVTLYLPFIGEVDLPADEVMGASVNVQYTVDFFTGMCVANVHIHKGIDIGLDANIGHYAQHAYQGNCAINIPIGSANYGNVVGSFVNAASAGLRTGMAGAISTLASEATSGGFKPTITTKGTLSANAGFCSILYPYLQITRPISAEPDNFQTVMGYTGYINNSIGECKGICVCDDIELAGISGATASEIARIKSLCKEGVRN